MHQLSFLCILWLIPPAFSSDDSVPRKFVPHHDVNPHLFHENGVFNYSTMLLRDDLDALVVGARGTLFALDLHNISRKLASVNWEKKNNYDSCKSKGKEDEDCGNYIRILHKMDDDRMFVCGTNAFNPTCDYMSFANGSLTLEKKDLNGKQKCPFDPQQRYASIIDGDALYSATYGNFLGNQPVFARSSAAPIRNEDSEAWFNEPTFVSMAQMPRGEKDEDNDDKVYLFFSETVTGFNHKLVVSRLARVCKEDLGGYKIMSKKWTTFLKATLHCPAPEPALLYIIQDTYLLCDPQAHWTDCLFYAIFTSPLEDSDTSVVCVYPVSHITTVFEEGLYKSPLFVERGSMMYNREIPFPRPGACVNNEARAAGINDTRDLPDRTLLFVRDRFLMDQVIMPVESKPLLLRKGAIFTRILVDQVQAADGKNYHVMFIGTEEGTLLKAVKCSGEVFIIEEMKLFQHQKPIKILKVSNVTRQLYAGSDSGVAQIPLASCERSLSCVDCVLARDPYCGWDNILGKCVAIFNKQRDIIQSVSEGNASSCPDVIKTTEQSFKLGENLNLSCPLSSNLATTKWKLNDHSLKTSHRVQQFEGGLLIFNASRSDAGLYSCLSVEHSTFHEYTITVVQYLVTITNQPKTTQRLQTENPAKQDETTNPIAYKKLGGQESGPHSPDFGLVIGVAFLIICLVCLLGWNFFKGHISVPREFWKRRNPAHPSAAESEKAEENPVVYTCQGDNVNSVV